MARLTIIYDSEDFEQTVVCTDAADRTYDYHLQVMINFLRGLGFVIPEEEDRV